MRGCGKPFSAHLRKPKCTVCSGPGVQYENLSSAEVSEMSCEVSEQENKTNKLDKQPHKRQV